MSDNSSIVSRPPKSSYSASPSHFPVVRTIVKANKKGFREITSSGQNPRNTFISGLLSLRFTFALTGDRQSRRVRFLETYPQDPIDL